MKKYYNKSLIFQYMYLGKWYLLGSGIVSSIVIFSQYLCNIDMLKQKLQEDNLIILAGERSSIYHAILLIGYDENKFIVCDPLYKTKQMRTFEEIDNFMNTSIGKWFISVNNKNRNSI